MTRNAITVCGCHQAVVRNEQYRNWGGLRLRLPGVQAVARGTHAMKKLVLGLLLASALIVLSCSQRQTDMSVYRGCPMQGDVRAFGGPASKMPRIDSEDARRTAAPCSHARQGANSRPSDMDARVVSNRQRRNPRPGPCTCHRTGRPARQSPGRPRARPIPAAGSTKFLLGVSAQS